ncbi:hypothetical protein [Thiocystis violacea]|uniref:hypothetical protein n=1 Tax=Thiocystis violacea TaxID=13725 RepID=UPI0019086F0B|nr:hypothetical protein [Thiocystis violacea]MBK1721793.1 hypothetical protein [Thiocystis violacea]
MNRSILFSAIALTLTFATAPASAVVYCKTVGVPKGCVVRPAVRVAPVVRPVPVPVAPVGRAVAAPKPGNWNGGVNRAGVRR